MASPAVQLQDHLERMRAGEPWVRLTDDEATEQAYRLRMLGMRYSAIAIAMATYHGYWLSETAWEYRCRNMGAPRTKGLRKGVAGR
jgi:hypothetical protein